MRTTIFYPKPRSSAEKPPASESQPQSQAGTQASSSYLAGDSPLISPTGEPSSSPTCLSAEHSPSSSLAEQPLSSISVGKLPTLLNSPKGSPSSSRLSCLAVQFEKFQNADEMGKRMQLFSLVGRLQAISLAISEMRRVDSKEFLALSRFFLTLAANHSSETRWAQLYSSQAVLALLYLSDMYTARVGVLLKNSIDQVLENQGLYIVLEKNKPAHFIYSQQGIRYCESSEKGFLTEPSLELLKEIQEELETLNSQVIQQEFSKQPLENFKALSQAFALLYKETQAKTCFKRFYEDCAQSLTLKDPSFEAELLCSPTETDSSCLSDPLDSPTIKDPLLNTQAPSTLRKKDFLFDSYPHSPKTKGPLLNAQTPHSPKTKNPFLETHAPHTPNSFATRVVSAEGKAANTLRKKTPFPRAESPDSPSTRVASSEVKTPSTLRRRVSFHRAGESLTASLDWPSPDSPTPRKRDLSFEAKPHSPVKRNRFFEGVNPNSLTQKALSFEALRSPTGTASSSGGEELSHPRGNTLSPLEAPAHWQRVYSPYLEGDNPLIAHALKTPSPSQTNSPTPSRTPSRTPSSSQTDSPIPSRTPSRTPSSSQTDSPIPSRTPSRTPSSSQTDSPIPSRTPSPKKDYPAAVLASSLRSHPAVNPRAGSPFPISPSTPSKNDLAAELSLRQRLVTLSPVNSQSSTSPDLPSRSRTIADRFAAILAPPDSMGDSTGSQLFSKNTSSEPSERNLTLDRSPKKQPTTSLGFHEPSESRSTNALESGMGQSASNQARSPRGSISQLAAALLQVDLQESPTAHALPEPSDRVPFSYSDRSSVTDRTYEMGKNSPYPHIRELDPDAERESEQGSPSGSLPPGSLLEEGLSNLKRDPGQPRDLGRGVTDNFRSLGSGNSSTVSSPPNNPHYQTPLIEEMDLIQNGPTYPYEGE